MGHDPISLVCGVNVCVELFQIILELGLVQFLPPQTGLTVVPDLKSRKANIAGAVTY